MDGYINDYSLKVLDISPVNLPKIGSDIVISTSLSVAEKYNVIKDVFGAYEPTSIISQVPGFVLYDEEIFYIFGSPRICSMSDLLTDEVRPSLISPVFIIDSDKLTDNPIHGTITMDYVVNTNSLGLKFVNVTEDVDYILHHLKEHDIRPSEFPDGDYYAIYDVAPLVKYSVSDKILFSNLNQYLIASDNPVGGYMPYVNISDSQVSIDVYNETGDVEAIDRFSVYYVREPFSFKLHQPGYTMFKDPYFAITQYNMGYNDITGIMELGTSRHIIPDKIDVNFNTPFNSRIIFSSSDPEYDYIVNNKESERIEMIINNYIIDEDQVVFNPISESKVFYNSDNIISKVMPYVSIDVISISDYMPSPSDLASQYPNHVVIDVIAFFKEIFDYDEFYESYADDTGNADYILKRNVNYENSQDRLSPYYRIDPDGTILNDMVYVGVVVMVSKDIGSVLYGED